MPQPKFYVGQKVELKVKPDSETVVSDVMWHYDKKEHYYLITLNDKKKKRYFESEFRI